MCGDKSEWLFSGFFQGACRAFLVWFKCSDSGRGGISHFFSKIRGEIILGAPRFMMGVVRLDKCLGVLDFFISGIEDILSVIYVLMR